MPDKEKKEEERVKVIGEESKIKLAKTMVLRCGGSSVSSPEAIEAIVKWVKAEIRKGTKIVILASSIPKERNEVIDFAKALDPDPPMENLNELAKYCDARSAQMLAIAFKKRGVPISVFTGDPIIIKHRQEGRVLYQVEPDDKRDKLLHMIRRRVDQGNLVICSGFKVIEGKNKISTTVLKDSNSSTVALAGLLGTDLCVINTSTDGIYQVDPRIVPQAQRIEYLSYHQMSHFAYMGARILSPRCVELAASLDVIVKVKLSPAMGESRGGTIIGPVKREQFSENKDAQKGIAVVKKVVKFIVSGGSFRTLMVSLPDICLIDTAMHSEGDGYIIVAQEDAEEVRKRIENKKYQFKEENNLASLTFIDWQMLAGSGYVNSVVKSLDRLLLSVNTAGDAISILVKEENIEEATRIIAKKFGLI